MTSPLPDVYMPPLASLPALSLRGRTVVITRPASTASAWVRQVRALAGVPVLLPGLSLRAVDDVAAACSQLAAALAEEMVIFSSPLAVRFAAGLLPLLTNATVLGVGAGTQRALYRKGLTGALAPRRQDSEGLLDLSVLHHLTGHSIALIGAAGGRGLLREQLEARGALVRAVHVYQRRAPRLDRRHVIRALSLPASSLVFFSSAEAMGHLCRLLPAAAWASLLGATAVVSSERLALAAGQAGFSKICRAASASSVDLLRAALLAP